MSSVNYRILVDSEKVRGVPAVRVVPVEGDGIGEVFAATAEDKTAVDFAVDLDTTANVYHGYLSAGDAEFVQVSDPTSLTAASKPGKAVATPTGKLYWVGVAAAAVKPAKARKQAVVADDVAPLAAVEPPAPIAVDAADAAPPVVVAEVVAPAAPAEVPPAEVLPATSTDDDLASALAPTSGDVDAALYVDNDTLPPPPVVADESDDKKPDGKRPDKKDQEAWMPVADFAKLTLKRKREYLHAIGIDGPVDMRTHSYMVTGYEKFFSARQQ